MIILLLCINSYNMDVCAEHIKSLHKYEVRLLKSLEFLMRRYSWVPAEELVKNSHLSASETDYRIGNLLKMGMIRYQGTPYKGYALLFKGYDSLALHSVTKKGTVQAFGSMIGVGKESQVYEGMGLGPVILKFHRVGQRSFQSVRKNRNYMPDEKHCPWIFASHYSADREYQALHALYPDVSVPMPIVMNRNLIVMSLIAGVNLNRCKLEEPKRAFDDIVEQVSKAYKKGFIHGDLSEHNIMVDEEQCYIIDWPQWVEPSHENADQILMHDVKTLITHFKRKYKFEINADDLMSSIKNS